MAYKVIVTTDPTHYPEEAKRVMFGGYPLGFAKRNSTERCTIPELGAVKKDIPLVGDTEVQCEKSLKSFMNMYNRAYSSATEAMQCASKNTSNTKSAHKK